MVNRLRTDLGATAAIAIACAAAVLVIPDARPLRAVLAMLLLLVLPGYALTEALFTRDALDHSRRAVLTLSLSVAADVLIGLALNLLPFGLRAGSWAVGAAAVTCAGCIAAALRRPGRARLHLAVSGLRIRAFDVLFVLAAALLLGATVAFARTPLTAKRAQGYTALWLQRGTDATSVRVGVKSGELEPTRYRLVVRVGRRIAYQRIFTLYPHAQMRRTLRVGPRTTPGGPVVATLSLASDPTGVYRLARLWPR